MNTPKIFIVEDDVEASSYISFLLSQQGYEVVGEVMSGEEAIAQIPRVQPDVLILDITLEDGGGQLDGIQVAEQLHRTFPVPVIFLTSYENTNIFNNIRTPYVAYLNKPPTSAKLVGAIKKAIEDTSLGSPPPLASTQAFLMLSKSKEKSELFKDELHRVSIDDIQIIKVVDRNLSFETIHGSFFLNRRMSLSEFLRQYSTPNLLQFSGSEIINTDHLTRTEGCDTLFINERHYFVSRKYKQAVKKRLIL